VRKSRTRVPVVAWSKLAVSKSNLVSLSQPGIFARASNIIAMDFRSLLSYSPNCKNKCRRRGIVPRLSALASLDGPPGPKEHSTLKAVSAGKAPSTPSAPARRLTCAFARVSSIVNTPKLTTPRQHPRTMMARQSAGMASSSPAITSARFRCLRSSAANCGRGFAGVSGLPRYGRCQRCCCPQRNGDPCGSGCPHRARAGRGKPRRLAVECYACCSRQEGRTRCWLLGLSC